MESEQKIFLDFEYNFRKILSVATHKTDKTMKKTYINPAMEIIKIASQTQMLAGSKSLGFGDSVNSAAGAESRGSDDWDDWDED